MGLPIAAAPLRRINITMAPETEALIDSTRPPGHSKSAWIALLARLGAEEWQRKHGNLTTGPADPA